MHKPEQLAAESRGEHGARPVEGSDQTSAWRGERVGLSAIQWFCKRVFDLLSVIVILILFAWVIVFVAIGVRLTTGSPVIFGQKRVGKDGRIFTCYKFRSMVPNAQEVLERLLASDPEARLEWQRSRKLKADPRVTRFGRFIRKMSFDEFPQLWNVVRGDMSIVGPRPVVPDEFEHHYEGARQHYRAVKPGLTGLWQVSGRNDVDYQSRVALDRHYVENWGLWLDFTVVMKTVGVMFARRGAY
jgi:lipopolysaccharide/colanic/teichoic acid biosynthesis glycosyltransferase